MIYWFYRRRLPRLRETLDALSQAAFQTAREVRKVSTKVDDVIARLKAVQATQDKTVGEVNAAKDEIAALTGEVAALRAIIDNAGDTIPAAKLAELDDAVSAVESRAASIDAALPDLPVAEPTPDPVPEPAPVDETGTSTSTDPAAPVDTGADAGQGEPPAAPEQSASESVNSPPFK